MQPNLNHFCTGHWNASGKARGGLPRQTQTRRKFKNIDGNWLSSLCQWCIINGRFILLHNSTCVGCLRRHQNEESLKCRNARKAQRSEGCFRAAHSASQTNLSLCALSQSFHHVWFKIGVPTFLEVRKVRFCKRACNSNFTQAGIPHIILQMCMQTVFTFSSIST
jgi:hypothetical protein